jgi:zinc D-Ala-D-Ala dipeptidase
MLAWRTIRAPLAAALAATGLSLAAVGHDGLPSPFVRLSAVAPSVEHDIRYATSDNLLGRPLAGYGDASCVLRRRTAEALARVQARLKRQGFGLAVFDCYRPQRAVRDLTGYVRRGEPQHARYHPAVSRQQLIEQGYIAARSGHATGLAVDLTLVHLTPQSGPPPAPACGGPRRTNEADMGTGFDCFDPLSWRGAKVSPSQAASRQILREAMVAEGFIPYEREWWHFSLPPRNAAERQAMDFPITRRD